jgi:hypothetical protein
MKAVLQSAHVAPSATSCSADPYTIHERVPIPKAVLDRVSTPAERHEMIARAAYYRAELRGFAPGGELDDWMVAEHEINALCGLIEPHPSWDSNI